MSDHCWFGDLHSENAKAVCGSASGVPASIWGSRLRNMLLCVPSTNNKSLLKADVIFASLR